MEPAHQSNPYHVVDQSGTDNPSNGSTVTQEKHQRLFKRGILWLGAGVFLMGISFMINFFLFQLDKSFSTPMYILTTLGICFIVKGLADILGF